VSRREVQDVRRSGGSSGAEQIHVGALSPSESQGARQCRKPLCGADGTSLGRNP
jgi:hypothetical protein